MRILEMSVEDIAMLIAIVSELNPDNFPSLDVKELIFRCKAASLTDGHITLRVSQ